MSLFPAYAASGEVPVAGTSETDNQNWLKNSSYPTSSNPIIAPQSETDTNSFVGEESERSTKRHSSRNKRNYSKIRKKEELTFWIDKKRTKEFLTVATISRPAVAQYKTRFYARTCRKGSKKRFKRYFQWRKGANDDESGNEGEIVTKSSLESLKGSQKDPNFTGFKQEVDLSQITAKFNKELNENRNNIKAWLEYSKFQDDVYNFEKTYRKGSVAKGLRVKAERKLAILDKALNSNPQNEELMRERLDVAVGIYPADELQIKLKQLIDKDQGNIILWQGYIESFQCSMSHCNSRSVIDLYSKCLSILHRLRRNSTMDRARLEENILNMLYQCGLFFKQSGLFEQLWTLLRLYLELNLSPIDKNQFNISSKFDDKQLVDLEEIVLTSQLPLHELWLRIEKLRESCHWLPCCDASDDPQRLVFADDVSELIHPITMAENIFKMTATILNLLKIPLLPCRFCTIQDLRLDYVPWSLDSIESLLPIFYPLHSVDLSDEHVVIDHRLAVGPQYLNVLPGQEEYLDFILAIMKRCADSLQDDKDAMATTIWWIRFQKLLIILDHKRLFRMPIGLGKKIKANIKNFLKEEKNRNKSIYYCEYAMIEKELNNTNSCLTIIKTALIGERDKSAVCYMIRILIEILHENHQEAIRTLIKYVLDRDVIETSPDLLTEAKMAFEQKTAELLQEPLMKLSVVEHFLPIFLTDFVMCHGWFLFLTESVMATAGFIDNVLKRFSHLGSIYQIEVLYEFYVGILYKSIGANKTASIRKLLDDVLIVAIRHFPNNMFLLSVLSKVQSITSNFGYPWWKLKSALLETGHALPILFLVIISNQQIVQVLDNFHDTMTGNKYEISHSSRNRMLSLFRRITRADMTTRRCGLIWRLYLQFVHAYYDPTLCRNVYYSAVEECPWLKALYIDAAIYIPAELAQIQDLIIEKQLRIHVTPEELDVLRS